MESAEEFNSAISTPVGNDGPPERMTMETDLGPMDVQLQQTGEVITMDVWRNLTGEKEIILQEMWPYVKDVTLPDGRFVFSTEPPDEDATFPTIYGDLKCRLHPDDPDAAEHRAMGWRECPKDGLSSPYDVDVHMRGYHIRIWEAMRRIESEKREDEWRDRDEEQRTVQIKTMNAMIAIADRSNGVGDHQHEYATKTSGAPCTVEGCQHTRGG